MHCTACRESQDLQLSPDQTSAVLAIAHQLLEACARTQHTAMAIVDSATNVLGCIYGCSKLTCVQR
jgi:hypothetical protein